MTYLELCQRLRQEAGISGTGPSAVTSQVGEMARVVDWIDTAYETIQNLHPDWDFLRFDFSFSTVASTQNYTPTAAGYSEHQTWKRDSLRCYLTATGATDETWLQYVPWEVFRDARVFGANRTVTGKPIEFSIKPDQSLAFFPIPDAIYTVVGEYWKRAQTMSNDSDEPLIPRQWQMIIVWEALKSYATHESAPEAMAKAERGYRKIITKMEAARRPGFGIAGPMA